MTRQHLLSQLAHVEILSPRPTETVAFFEQQLGLEISERRGQSVYLRGWGEFFHHSLKVTESARPGLGHVGWRTDSAEALIEAARLLEATKLGEGWIDGDQGHGRAYRFRSPDGHLNEVFWEVERWQAPPELKSTLRDRPQKSTGLVAAGRWLNHLNLSTSQVRDCREFYQQHLGFCYHGSAFLDGTDTELIAFLAVTVLDHDLAFTLNAAGAHGRLNHVAFQVDTREDLLRAADIMRDYDPAIIEIGPGRHAGGGAFYLYLREPGGNRIELYTGETLILAPDWEPVRWLASENPMMYWGGEVPQSMYVYATPPLEMPQGAQSSASAGQGSQTSASRTPLV